MDPITCGYNFCIDAILRDVNNSPYSSSNTSLYYQQLVPNVTIQAISQKVFKKKSGTRAVFTMAQRRNLESVFCRQQYIDKVDRKKLAEALNLAEPQVKVWFQNRRSKLRRDQTKLMEELQRDQYRFNSSNSVNEMLDDDDDSRKSVP